MTCHDIVARMLADRDQDRLEEHYLLVGLRSEYHAILYGEGSRRTRWRKADAFAADVHERYGIRLDGAVR